MRIGRLSYMIRAHLPDAVALYPKMYRLITQTIDPLIASVSTVLIVLAFLVMLNLGQFYGLDKIFIGKG